MEEGFFFEGMSSREEGGFVSGGEGVGKRGVYV